MIQKSRVLFKGYFVLCFSLIFTVGNASEREGLRSSLDTLPPEQGSSFLDRNQSPFDLSDPSIIEKKVEYDPVTGTYILTEKIGEDFYRAPTYMSFKEYTEWKAKQQEKEFFGRLAGVSTGKGASSSLDDPLKEFTKDVNLLDRLFGGNKISVKPQGNIDVTLGVRYFRTENPILPIQQQAQTVPDFDMTIRMNVNGQIGKKLSLNANFNTEQQFNFENQFKLHYDSELFNEDDIVKNIEAGNVSLPLRSSLIQGAQSLMGIKADLQFGHLRLTAIASQQQSRRDNLVIQNGSQVQQFEVRADQYDENRHFFITHFNREDYERALSNLPQVNTLFKINRIEVWRTNIQNETQRLREIVAIADLAEPERLIMDDPSRFLLNVVPSELRDITGKTLPDNRSNTLYEQISEDPSVATSASLIPALVTRYGLRTGRDFELKRAQRLRPNEYTLNEQLGIISLNTPLRQEEVLAVSVEYDYNGKTYRIGEFSMESESDSTQVLITKMLKTATPDVTNALWDLMMKNVYSVDAYQVQSETFNLDIFYDDPGEGFKRFLPELGPAGQPLLQLFNLDQLNAFGDPQADGRFDFVPGITIDPRAGRIYFPVLEPFGSSLQKSLNNDEIYEQYEYRELYDSTIFIAQEFQEKNRFVLRGRYESSVSSDIQLGAYNIPEGSVRVTAGGRVLRENIDYEINYRTGRIKILNDSYLASGAPINVEFEDRSLFSFQRRNMIGLRADYELNEHITLGGTFMQYWELPITQKVNIGNDPVNNRVVGLDASYNNEAPWLTKVVDALPGIETKEASSINAYVEGAALIPGYSRAINLADDEGSSVYLDDFEGTAARIDITQPIDRWSLASIPAGDREDPLFPEAFFNDDPISNVNRALINWYRFDPLLSDSSTYGPGDAYARVVRQEEIFPNRTLQPGLNIFRPLDITYYPDEKGPYNYDVPNGYPGFSAGVEPNTGKLRDPESRWGGIMRGLTVNDFQTANIEYIEFWMLNPFIRSPQRGNEVPEGGELYIELGNISEDILKDGRAAFENALPVQDQTLPLDTTNLGIVPLQAPFVNAFSNNEADRPLQDVGLDCMADEFERQFLNDYINQMTAAGINVASDPAGDNFLHYQDNVYDNTNYVLERYKAFNHVEGNSPINTGTTNVQAFSFLPSTEDVNRDFTSDRIEGYFQYRIPIESDDANPNALKLTDYITDEINTRGGDETWYRFVVPVQEFQKKVGSIQDFRSIRFIRMYLTGFDKMVTLRFATLDLVRNSWRRFTRNNLLGGGLTEDLVDNTTFSINQVGIEENSEKIPYNYVIPPGIQREQNFQATAQNQLLNESSLAIDICNLNDGEARAVFRNDTRDLRLYKRLKMFVHAESEQNLDPGDLKLFIRMGSDYINNYYEYEIPLTTSEFLDPTGTRDADVIWPDINELDFALQELIDVKTERNAANVDKTLLYEKIADANPEHLVRVKGNPNLGYVKGFLVGLRNTNDGKGDICAEVWLNEMRVTGLDRRGGAAALARVDMQLADLGNLSFSGSASTIGWGGIDKRLQERARESTYQYDVSTNLALGKLFGENSPIRLPFYAQLSNITKTPEFDPYDLDIKLKDKLDNAQSNEQRDSIRDQAIDQTTIRSFNFTNVRITPNRNKEKEKPNAPLPTGVQPSQKQKPEKKKPRKPKPWDIENFTFSYAFSETDHSDPIIAEDNTITHNGNITYAFAYQPLYIEPFKKVIKNRKLLGFIKELHLNPLPNSFSVSTNVNRYLNTRRYRFTIPEFSTWYDRRFTWDRTYGLKWDLTRSLRINYNATHQTVIDELDQNGVDFRGDTLDIDPKTYRWNNIQDFGRPKNYSQSIQASWQVPLKNFPFLDFMDVRAQASANYNWSAAPINIDSLGNIIQNNQNFSVNSTLNFERIYNKVSYFRKLDQTRRPNLRNTVRGRRGKPADEKKPTDKKDGEEKERKKKKREGPSVFEKILVRPLLSLRRIQFNWQEEFGNTLPGFFPEAELFGMDNGFSAPGWEYALGFRPSQEWLFDAAENKGWISASRFQSQEVINSYRQNWKAEANIEPWKDFRIDVSMNKDYRISSTALFKNDNAVVDPYTGFREANYVYSPRNDFGSYTISFLALNTLFRDSQDELNTLFTTFESHRSIISERLYPEGGEHEEDPSIYKEGFGRKQQDVLTAAFLSAYTETDPNTVGLDLFETFPMPNWSVNYNGLGKLPGLRNIFRNVRISHGYQSTLTVNSFQRNAAFLEDDPRSNENKDIESNFYSRFVIPQIVIDERFSPLIGVNVQTVNNMNFEFNIGRTRNLQLSFTDSKLFESKSQEYTFGFGYTLEDVKIGFLSFGKKNKKSKSENNSQSRNNRNSRPGGNRRSTSNQMVFNMNFKYIDDVTNAYEIDATEDPTPTRGLTTLQINPSVDYDVNRFVRLRLFMDYSRTVPKTSLSFPITNVRGGLTLRFKLN